MSFWKYLGIAVALCIVIGFFVLVGSAEQTMKEHTNMLWFISGIFSGIVVTSLGFYIWFKATHKI
jgi:uncharacterized membrane protein